MMIFFKVGKFMCQPCVKFVAHTFTYLVFIGLIIASSLQLTDEERKSYKFSNDSSLDKYLPNFTAYVNNPKLMYRFPDDDFYFRSNSPSAMDLITSLWIVGKCFIFSFKFYIKIDSFFCCN
jgi:hypothetical protein